MSEEKLDEYFDEEEEYFAEHGSSKKAFHPFSNRNTIEFSDKGLSDEMLSEMIENEIKIRKIKIKALKEEKRQIKQYLKENLMAHGTKEAN